MTLDLKAIILRAEKYHSKAGPVVEATKEVLETTYPAGTNLILMWLLRFIGTPYGAKNMCMDRVVDCAELWRITFYIWFGMDIGNYSDAQYLNKSGVIVTEDFDTLPKCRPLTLVFYKTSSKKRSGHVAGIFDETRILQSGASEHKYKVGLSKITWGRKYFTAAMYAKDFLTDEQYYSVIVGGEEGEKEAETFTLSRILKFGVRGEDVKWVQSRLKKLGYFKGAVKGNFLTLTTAATKAFQKAVFPKDKSEWDGKVGKNTIAKLGGVWVGK